MAVWRDSGLFLLAVIALLGLLSGFFPLAGLGRWLWFALPGASWLLVRLGITALVAGLLGLLLSKWLSPA